MWRKKKTPLPEAGLSGSSEPLVAAEELRKVGNQYCNKGDFADACFWYDKGLLALEDAKFEEAEKDKAASQLRVAMHLNLSLTHLRRGSVYCQAADQVGLPAFSNTWEQSLLHAVRHGDAALAIEPENEKGLLRRGCARSRLSELEGHEAEAASATADLERVLEMNPDNKEAQKQLKMRKQYDSQRPAVCKNCVRADADGQPVLSAVRVRFVNYEDEAELAGVSLDLRAGRCLGLFSDSSSGLSTLARVLSGKLMPSRGKLIHHGKMYVPPGAPVSTSIWVLVSSISFVIFLGMLLGLDPLNGKNVAWLAENATHVELTVVCGFLLIILIAIKLRFDRTQAHKTVHSVVHVVSDPLAVKDIPAAKTVEDIICSSLPKHLSSEQRHSRALAMIKASGCEPKGKDYANMRFGDLSAAQKHLVNLLRCVASCPDILICEDVLGSLEVAQRPRVLHMLRRMKEELRISILYISADLQQLRVVADTVGHLQAGSIVEHGQTAEVLDSPMHEDTKASVSALKANDESLSKSVGALANDADLAGDWLPR